MLGMADTGTGIQRLPPDAERALLRGRWFFQRGNRPGFVAVGEPGAEAVPIFSSSQQLARYAGACEWASTTGEDLFGLLPEDCGLVVDPAGPAPRYLPAEVLSGLRAWPIGEVAEDE
jgi:hypothetical protein